MVSITHEGYWFSTRKDTKPTQSKCGHSLVVLRAEPGHVQEAFSSKEARVVRELPSALRRLKPTVHPEGSTVLILQGLESIVGIEMHEGDYTGETRIVLDPAAVSKLSNMLWAWGLPSLARMWRAFRRPRNSIPVSPLKVTV